MENPFEAILKKFITNIECIEMSCAMIMVTYGEFLRKIRNSFEKLIEAIPSDEPQKTQYLIDNYTKLRKHSDYIDKFINAKSIVPRSFIVTLVSEFDVLLSGLIKTIFRIKPSILNSSEKKFSLVDLMSFDTVDDAKDFFIDKEIDALLRENHAEHFNWLEKKLDMQLRKDLAIWSTFIEITERRNLYVHCDAIVTPQYIKICKQHKVPLSDDIRSGIKLDVSEEYFKEAFECIFEMGVKLIQVIWRKLQEDDIDEADSYLNDIAYNLIENENYELAIRLLEFGVRIKKHLSKENETFMIINLAQAYKWSGDTENLNRILKQDWSVYNNKFKMAIAVLQDDFDQAIDIMKRIGTSGEIDEFAYQEWPIFKEIRKNGNFNQTFEYIFKKPLKQKTFDNYNIKKEKEIGQKAITVEQAAVTDDN